MLQLVQDVYISGTVRAEKPSTDKHSHMLNIPLLKGTHTLPPSPLLHIYTRRRTQ